MKLKTPPPIKIDFNSSNLHLEDYYCNHPGKYELKLLRPCLKLQCEMYNCHDKILNGYQRIPQSLADRTIILGFEIYPKNSKNPNEYSFDININNSHLAYCLFHEYSGKVTDQVILKVDGFGKLCLNEHGLLVNIHIDKIINTYSKEQLSIGDFHIIGIVNKK